MRLLEVGEGQSTTYAGRRSERKGRDIWRSRLSLEFVLCSALENESLMRVVFVRDRMREKGFLRYTETEKYYFLIQKKREVST